MIKYSAKGSQLINKKEGKKQISAHKTPLKRITATLMKSG